MPPRTKCRNATKGTKKGSISENMKQKGAPEKEVNSAFATATKYGIHGLASVPTLSAWRHVFERLRDW